MENKFLPNVSPAMGVPMHFSIADFPPSRQTKVVPVLENVVADETSAAVALGARGVRLFLTAESADATCDVLLYKVVDAQDVLVKSWVGVQASDTLYAGNQERVDLQGADIKVAVANISKGWVGVSVMTLY